MKKIGALLLTLALCLLFAICATAEGDVVARNGDAIAAYLDGDGSIFLPGKAEAINEKEASGIVCVDNYRLLFLSPDAFLSTDSLYMIDLESFEETLIAPDVAVACPFGEDTVWYVSNADRTRLMRFDLNALTKATAYTAPEPIDRLYASAEGLVLQMVDQAGAMIQTQQSDQFDVYTQVLPRQSLLTDDYELYLSQTGELYLKRRDNYATDLLDSDVLAFTQMGGKVYYLCHTGSAIRLKSYDPSAMVWQVVLTPGSRLENQITASAGQLFLLGTDGSVYSADVAKGTLTLLKRYDNLSSYALPMGYEASGLRIEAMSGQLNVYAVLTEKAAKPDFSFIEFESDSEAAQEVLKLIDTRSLSGEQTAWDALKPAAQYTTLSRGSRGDAVRAIQQPLFNLGYYDYYVDGIFGPRTEFAIQLLQSDLERPVTGKADAELQRLILSNKLAAYDPYIPRYRGDRGLRVQLMQQRLRDLGYLADAADGIYGPRTQKAAQLFQSENGLVVTEEANRLTLQRLYSDRAERCSSYIDLYPGDTGYRVRELNNRLKELYYLESSVGSTYTSQTTSAVRVFQRTMGLPETGRATTAVLRLLFSKDAPEAPGYITLRRGDENSRVERLQIRLKDLGYFDGPISGYYGKSTRDAVLLFQTKVGLKPTGVATVRTQQLLFAADAPVYVPPTILGTPVISLDAYDYVENDVYCISDTSSSTGYITFGWYAEGDVASYNVRITDATGVLYLDTNTQMNLTGVSVSTLKYDVTYTLRITAIPADGDSSHITSASIAFTRIQTAIAPTVGSVGTPMISIDTVARMENDVNYLLPGTATFHWLAEGDVESYYVEVRDESDALVISMNTTERQTVINTASMNQGEIYTLFVYAIPTNGTMADARSRSARFALPVIELPVPDPTPEPTPEPTAAPLPEAGPAQAAQTLNPVPTLAPATAPTEPPTAPAVQEPASQTVVISAPVITINFSSVDANGVELVTDDIVQMDWHAEGDVQSYYVEVIDSDNQVIASTTTEQTSLSAKASNLVPGEVYTLDVTAIPQDGEASDGQSSAILFGVPSESTVELPTEPQAEPNAQPVPSDNREEPVTGQPQAEPQVEPAEQRPASEPQSEPVEQPIAEPQSEPAEQPAAEPQSEPTEQTIVEPQSEPVEKPASEPQAAPEEQTVAEPQVAPAEQPSEPEPVVEIGVVSAPALSLAPSLGSDEGGVTVIDGAGEVLQMYWYAEGDVDSYYVEIYDASNQLIASTQTSENSLSAYISLFSTDQVYLLNVVAVPINGSLADGLPGSVTFRVQPDQNSEAIEPSPESQTEPEPQSEYPEPEPEIPEFEPEVIPQYQEPEPQPEPEVPEIVPQDEPTYSEPQTEPEPPSEYPEPQAEPEPEVAPVIGVVSVPSIHVEPSLGIDESGTTVVDGSADAILLQWFSEGDVDSYYVEIFDAAYQSVASTQTTETSLSTYVSAVAPDQVYVMSVTAIPVNGGLEDGQTGYAAFRVQLPQVEEPTPADEEPQQESYEPMQESQPEPYEPVQEPQTESYEPVQEPQPEPYEPVQESQPESYEPVQEPQPESYEPEQEPQPEPYEPVQEPQSESYEPEYQEQEQPAILWDTPIDAYSDPAMIQLVQIRLTEWFWLLPESYTPGVLDAYTIQAVESFQNYCMANYEVVMTPVYADPMNPSIDVVTLSVLMNDAGVVLANPDYAY